jgi:hypothetical protein
MADRMCHCGGVMHAVDDGTKSDRYRWCPVVSQVFICDLCGQEIFVVATGSLNAECSIDCGEGENG